MPDKHIRIHTKDRNLKISKREVILTHTTEQLHFPFLYEAKDGTWYMTYREGPHGPPGGDRVHCTLSHDRGATWKPYPGLRAGTMNLRLFYRELSDGTLLANRYTSRIDKDGEHYMEMLRSGDDGCVWLEEDAPLMNLPSELRQTESVTIYPWDQDTPSVAFWGRCIELEANCLIQGFYMQDVTATKQTGYYKYITGLFKSEDMGSSWRFLSYICTDTTLGANGSSGTSTVRHEGSNELDIEVLPNGDILSVFRTGGPIYMSRSTDKGNTWSPAVDTGVVGVSPQLLLLENNTLVMSYGTRDVYVRASMDGLGKAWTEPLLLYKGPGTGYTHMQALGPSQFRVVFDESPFADKEGIGGQIVRVEVCVT
jgi:hypothetical protein